MFKMVPSIFYNSIILFIYFTVIYTYSCVFLHMLLECFFMIFFGRNDEIKLCNQSDLSSPVNVYRAQGKPLYKSIRGAYV